MEEHTLQLITWRAAIIVAMAYGIGMYSLFGITRSISITYEHLKRLDRNKGKLFTLAMQAIGILMAMAGSTVLTVLAGGMLCVTGAAASTKTPISGPVHYFGSYATIALSITAIGVDFGLWYLAIGTGIGVLALWYFEVKNNTYWLEWLTLFSIAGAIRYGIYML